MWIHVQEGFGKGLIIFHGAVDCPASRPWSESPLAARVGVLLEAASELLGDHGAEGLKCKSIRSSTLVLTPDETTKGLDSNVLRMHYVDNVCYGMRVIISPKTVFVLKKCPRGFNWSFQ